MQPWSKHDLCISSEIVHSISAISLLCFSHSVMTAAHMLLTCVAHIAVCCSHIVFLFQSLRPRSRVAPPRLISQVASVASRRQQMPSQTMRPNTAPRNEVYSVPNGLRDADRGQARPSTASGVRARRVGESQSGDRMTDKGGAKIEAWSQPRDDSQPKFEAWGQGTAWVKEEVGQQGHNMDNNTTDVSLYAV